MSQGSPHEWDIINGKCIHCGIEFSTAIEEELTCPSPLILRNPTPGGSLPYVSVLLNDLSSLFAERNAVYKDNFRMVGQIMVAMFPDGPPRLDTSEDYNRWHLFELAIVKLSRYMIAYNEGGHKDSLDDMIVYLSMVAALDAENGHRS